MKFVNEEFGMGFMTFNSVQKLVNNFTPAPAPELDLDVEIPDETRPDVSYEDNGNAPFSEEGIKLGLYSEGPHGAPELDIVIPLTTTTASTGPVTQHFETIPTTAKNDKETSWTKREKVIAGGSLLAIAFLMLQK